MSEKEFSGRSVLIDVQARRLRIDDAAQLLQLKRRQVFRLLKGLREDGAASRSWACAHLTWDAFHQTKERMPLQQPKLQLPYRSLQVLAVQL